MADIAKLTAANATRWAKMKVRPDLVGQIDAVARRLVAPAAKARFAALSARTGVPWPIIAVIKEREAGADALWTRSIAQGDPWNRVSTHVPSGRGPFDSWDAAAYDALVNCAPHAARWKDWSPGGAMTLLEQYNGLGYANRGLPSPYIWASTDQYSKGKYVRDGVFDPNFVDQQLGCAALLARMAALDQSATLGVPAPKAAPPASGAKAAATIAAAGGAAGVAHTAGLSGSTTLFIALAALVAVGVLFAVLHSRNNK